MTTVSQGEAFYIDHLISQHPVFAAHWVLEKFIALPRTDLSAVAREL